MTPADSKGLRVLVVDDEPSIRLAITEKLRQNGHVIVGAADGIQANEALEAAAFDVLITDVRMPRMDGLQLFRRARRTYPETAVILITAYADVSEAVTFLKEGAADYLTKPCDLEEVSLRVERIADRLRLERELNDTKRDLAVRALSSAIVGRTPSIVRLLGLIETVATTDTPVLITGESGTGKELAARTIHARSARHGGPFVAISCAAFSETLLEAELFGHEKGAFTGAVQARIGRFQAAAGGTLFLDEIADVPPLAQAKLLRAVETCVVEPLGSDRRIPVDVRLISASNRNLSELVDAGEFRADLFYRLNVLEIGIPPLRDRRGDLPLLVDHFLRRMVAVGRSPPQIAPRAWAALSEHTYPGNVRELQHAIEHAVVLSRGDEIDLPHLPDAIAGERGDHVSRSSEIRPLAVAAAEFEREYLLRALEDSEGKKAKAAEQLGISRKNLWEKLRSHGL